MLDSALGTGDLDAVLPILDELWDSDVVYQPPDVVPETKPIHGPDGLLRFIADQMAVFEEGTAWLAALEYIDAGDRLVVPYHGK